MCVYVLVSVCLCVGECVWIGICVSVYIKLKNSIGAHEKFLPDFSYNWLLLVFFYF